MSEQTVRVELVWPEERGAKDDCRAGTGVVWSGKGDIQDYPAALWPRLALHPDVWRLVDAPKEPPSADEEARIDAERARSAGAEIGADTVLVGLAGPGSTPHRMLGVDELADMSDEAVYSEGALRGYRLHPRLNPVNLRAKFLEQQGGVE